MNFVFDHKASQDDEPAVGMSPSWAEHRLIRRVCMHLLTAAATRADTPLSESEADVARRYVESTDMSPGSRAFDMPMGDVRILCRLLVRAGDLAAEGSANMSAADLARHIGHELDTYELRLALSRISAHHFSFQP